MYNKSKQLHAYEALDEIICRANDPNDLVTVPSPVINNNVHIRNQSLPLPAIMIHDNFNQLNSNILPSKKISKSTSKSRSKSKSFMNKTFINSTSSFQLRSNRLNRSPHQFTIEEFIESLKLRHCHKEYQKKPPYPYALLILLALLQNNENRLTLSHIYDWISTRFPFFKRTESTWQNSIRHNLSLNEAFMKTIKSPDKKSYLWEFNKGYETKFFKDLKLSFNQLKNIVNSIDQFFDIKPIIKIDTVIQKVDFNPLPTPPTTNDHSLIMGLAPAFDINTSFPTTKNNNTLHVPNRKPSIIIGEDNVICNIDEKLDALRTPEFKNHESIVGSPLTPTKLESIQYSNMIFFKIWNQDDSF